jgi:hypothetical protein
MIESLITSKTRIKLLLKFFLNSQNTGYLRNLETEFCESTNSIRIELNRLEQAGLLTSASEGNKKIYAANTGHPLFNDINSIVKKVIGIDKIIEKVLSQIGDLSMVYLVGNLASGRNSDTVELVLTGNNIDRTYIDSLVGKTEPLIHRKIAYKILTRDELVAAYAGIPILLIWSSNL